MMQKWQQLLDWLDGLSLRERLLVVLCGVAVVAMLCQTVAWGPTLTKQKRLTLELRRLQGELASTQTDIELRLKAHEADPNTAERKRLADLNKQRGAVLGHLRDGKKGLVPPEAMAALMEKVLATGPNIRLIRVNPPTEKAAEDAFPTMEGLWAKVHMSEDNALTAAAAGRAPPAASAPPPPGPAAVGKPIAVPSGPLYRHAVVLTVEGGYGDLLLWLHQLENLQWKLYWGEMALDARHWPKARMTVQINTLSLDPKWMNL